ncbi:hypothetical protein CYLTODRAFT_479750 [Cylindrobasidium torrendii FP15055 ss-10]|uniref:Uncharacterized protein n=1 Tax=Cylindrobasidium torrendii FP15055 ss-10 TaxID=1314674 RepID=A0A0D7AV42_9AGAR|nr:hypothetical protein CYLTODRAFT_479750 [Cylindrobasidium torrendii FP15055 ss-10]
MSSRLGPTLVLAISCIWVTIIRRVLPIQLLNVDGSAHLQTRFLVDTDNNRAQTLRLVVHYEHGIRVIPPCSPTLPHSQEANIDCNASVLSKSAEMIAPVKSLTMDKCRTGPLGTQRSRTSHSDQEYPCRTRQDQLRDLHTRRMTVSVFLQVVIFVTWTERLPRAFANSRSVQGIAGQLEHLHGRVLRRQYAGFLRQDTCSRCCWSGGGWFTVRPQTLRANEAHFARRAPAARSTCSRDEGTGKDRPYYCPRIAGRQSAIFSHYFLIRLCSGRQAHSWTSFSRSPRLAERASLPPDLERVSISFVHLRTASTLLHSSRDVHRTKGGVGHQQARCTFSADVLPVLLRWGCDWSQLIYEWPAATHSNRVSRELAVEEPSDETNAERKATCRVYLARTRPASPHGVLYSLALRGWIRGPYG